MKNKDCLIFQTHVAKPGARLAFSKLNVEVSSRFDLKLLVDVTQAHIPTALFGMEPLCFNLKETNQEHVYVQKCAQHPGTLWPRNIDLPLLWFFNSNNAQYRYYWVMEYDVRFTGNWNYFFDAFEQSASDLLATTLYRYEFRPGWDHWPTLRCPEAIPMEERVRGLFPIYRLSNNAIRAIDSAYRKDWAGHYEVTIPTILDQSNMTLEDIGGNGSFVHEGNENQFYINSPQYRGLAPGTFTVAQNSMPKSPRPNTLYHPIKG